MFDTVITLIAETVTQNSYGALIFTEIPREVLCRCKSIGRADFYSGKQAGLALDYVFETHPSNYQGERELEYEGERYAITRTYLASADTIELYAGLKVGVRDGSD